jgi:hypothetical protein
LKNIKRSRLHTTTDVSESYFASGEIAFNDNVNLEVGSLYSFTVAAVTNILATANDLSYNKDMVDWNQTFYPKIQTRPDGVSVSQNDREFWYPQPFLKYVYDCNGERIVTKGYAIDNPAQGNAYYYTRGATHDPNRVAYDVSESHGYGDKSVDNLCAQTQSYQLIYHHNHDFQIHHRQHGLDRGSRL